jgi:ADP-ribose pyrophosphatase YjhB (NUDIX family)
MKIFHGLTLSLRKKEQLSRVVAFPLMKFLMMVAMRLLISRQRIGVGVVCIDERGRILILKHVFHPDTPWGLPGGWIKRGEDPGESVLRELHEETGLTAELGPAIYISREELPGHIGMAFIAHAQSGEMKLSSEIIDAKWCYAQDIPGPLLPFTINAVSAAGSVIDEGSLAEQ